MARLIVSDEARSDISTILGYLRREAGSPVALDYADGFGRAADLLAQFPGMGTPRAELGIGARSVMVKPYIVIYDYDAPEEVVTILRVVHGRRNITADLIRR
jgi:toxin ParE1/3/4